MASDLTPPPPSSLARLWADLEASGWRDAILRYASHGVMFLILGLAIWAGRLNSQLLDTFAAKASVSITEAAPTPVGVVLLPTLSAPEAAALVPVNLVTDAGSLTRLADLHTLVPARGRLNVITYTVQKGDTLFGIADKYSLKPETVLWGNYFTLKDDPHLLYPGQVLNILPVDGTYEYMAEGSKLEDIAKARGVEPQDIVDWPGNNLDPNTPRLTPGQWLVVPGGQRELQSWQLPNIDRTTTSSRNNNFGQCPGGYTGAIGDGVFGWPADNHTLSGYDYTVIHHGLDIRATQGAAIYAVDSGVVVYAGWNDFGYGNLVVIDHGNGWTSVYGHLSQWNVDCGESVFRGNLIGRSGNTGRSSGAHLHFELKFNGGYVNPWNVLP